MILYACISAFLQTIPPDGGPWYAETDLSRAVAEPWNAYSSLTFLLPVCYWFWRIRGNYRNYPFLIACMPLLTLGGIGSTIYHAFRTSGFFLLMDVLPIALLTLLVGIYFWWKITSRWLFTGVIVAIFVLLRVGIFYESALLPQQRVNLSYLITGIMIFLPALALLVKTRFKGASAIVAAAVFFAISLLFRQIDAKFDFFPMGTHWLWHVCCATGAFFLAQYLYLIARLEPDRINA